MSTHRAIQYVGYACDIHCKFCMYGGDLAPMKGWRDLTELKQECFAHARIWGDSHADISGGEPSIYPHLMDLLDYYRNIGTKPRIITHGQHLPEMGLEAFRSGLDDILISIHAEGSLYDKVTGTTGGLDKIANGLDRLKKVPIRFARSWSGDKRDWNFSINTLINTDTIEGICRMPRLYHELQPRTVSFLNQVCPPWDRISRHSDVAKAFMDIVYDLPDVPIKIRYIPFCMLPADKRKHIVNWPQIPADPLEWDYASWFKVHPERMAAIATLGDQTGIYGKDCTEKFYNTFAQMVAQNATWFHPPKCEGCSHRMICEGISRDYYERFGDDELNPQGGELIKNPAHYFDNGQAVTKALSHV